MIVDIVNNIKRCVKCRVGKKATQDNFYFQNGRPHGKCIECQKLPEEREYRKEYNRRVRMAALVFYGGEVPRCACCRETEVKFLGIDHMNGGGSQHRKEMGKGGIHIYLWLRKNGYPDGFQVLCHNCNLAKGYYGKCPHLIKT